MKNWKTFAAASCLGLLTFVPSANADQWNKRTIITVGEPIQVPGKVLQPGKYVMKLMDSPSNRHIVQIFNEREDQLQTTILAIPNYRLQPTGDTEFQWWEVPAGQPRALRAWFYPGDNFGQEFAYPKNEAVAIAASNTSNVPTTYAQTETELATARVGTIDRAGTEMELDRQTYSRAEGNTTEMAQNRTTAGSMEQSQSTHQSSTMEQTRTTQQQSMDMSQSTAGNSGMSEGNMNRTTSRGVGDTLPRTSTALPLIGLAGLLAVGAGSALRAFGNRR